MYCHAHVHIVREAYNMHTGKLVRIQHKELGMMPGFLVTFQKRLVSGKENELFWDNGKYANGKSQ